MNHTPRKGYSVQALRGTAALRYLRLAAPQVALTMLAPWRASAPPRPGVVGPLSPAEISVEETTRSRKFLGISLVHSRLFSQRRQDGYTRPVQCNRVTPPGCRAPHHDGLMRMYTAC
jgi:hypothetical protein